MQNPRKRLIYLRPCQVWFKPRSGTHPDLIYLQSRWAALIPYEQALRLFEDVLPIEGAISYAEDNADYIVNYARRYHDGLPISSSMAESAVNQIISHRFVKKQQMRWSPKGAHKLLQVRTAVLNDGLAEHFKLWYPGFATNDPIYARAA